MYPWDRSSVSASIIHSLFFSMSESKLEREKEMIHYFSGFLLFFLAGGKNFGRSWTSAGFCGKLARWNKFLLLCSTYQKCLNSRTNSSGAFLFVQKNWWSLTVLNCISGPKKKSNYGSSSRSRCVDEIMSSNSSFYILFDFLFWHW